MSMMLLVLAAQGFIVVAPESFHDALAGYRDRAEIVALETVLKTDGADDPERLKRWLYERWTRDKIRYVLLVGDADVMPVRYMVLDRVTAPAFDIAFYPCDLYYADLARDDGSFDDWNANGNAYYGEVRGEKNKSDPINFDAVSYKPELALGRWPVSTADEVARVAAMTLGHKPARKAAFVHIGGWVDTRDRLDAMADALGWETAKLYGAKEDDVIAAINGGAGLVVHSGHGSDDSWAECFSTASIARVKRAPVLMSAGCSTARLATLPPYEAYMDAAGTEHRGTNAGEVFEAPPPPPAPYQRDAHNPTGLGERLLREGGAVAYIGCNTGSQPCGMTLVEGFVRSKAATVGDRWADAVTYYVDAENLMELKPNDDWYPPSIFFQGMKFMLFGDPTVRLVPAE